MFVYSPGWSVTLYITEVTSDPLTFLPPPEAEVIDLGHQTCFMASLIMGCIGLVTVFWEIVIINSFPNVCVPGLLL